MKNGRNKTKLSVPLNYFVKPRYEYYWQIHLVDYLGSRKVRRIIKIESTLANLIY